MSWILLSLICLLCWGFADVFYKKSNNENERYSHLKTAIWVGFIMGISSFILLLLNIKSFSFDSLIKSVVIYSPASLSYIISMIIGYAGLRYLEVSIVSPLENSSGAISAVLMLIFFLVSGQIQSVSEIFNIYSLIGTVLVIAGVVFLAVTENTLKKEEKKALGKNKKYRYGALALLFPLLYCVFDSIGTAADGIILSDNSFASLSETDVLILYGFTFFFISVILYIFLLIKERKPYNPFKKTECSKLYASLFEEGGQIFYVFAMAKEPILAAPLIAAYSFISVILSHIILKERLKLKQYISVIFFLTGIILLSVSEFF